MVTGASSLASATPANSETVKAMNIQSAIIPASLRLLVALAVGGLGTRSFAERVEAARPAFLNLPLYFEANHGQTGGEFEFIARGQTRSVQLAPQRALVSLVKVARNSGDRRGIAEPGNVSGHSVGFEFIGANPHAHLSGEGELPGRINYFLGSDPSGWQRSLSTFVRVRAPQIYPGVDLVYYGNQERLEYDFVVQPGARPESIAFRVSGANKMRVDANGDLVITLGSEEVRQFKPVAYQDIAGVRRGVRASYRLRGQTVSFELGAFDRTQPLVIDPIFSVLTYFSGSAADIAWDVAFQTDGTNGYLFVAGETLSANLPATVGAFTNKYAGGSAFGGDAFVAKLNLNQTTSNLVFLTYLGGRSHDGALSLAVDGTGNAFITGYTASTNFPVVGSLRTNLNGGVFTTPTVQNKDAFVTKLSASGSNLVYSAYLGGSGADEGFGIAVNATGVAYVTGYTESTNFPVVNSPFTNQVVGDDAFVTRISADGQSFGYSFPFGGFGTDRGEGIVADASGNAYVCGFTRSFNFPITTNVAFQLLANQQTNTTTVADAFLLKVSPAGSVEYSSFLGGWRDDIAFNVALDVTGDLYLCGATASTNFVVTATNIHSGLTSNSIATDAFITKFDPTLTNVIYSVIFGGGGTDEARDLTVDSLGRANVVGDTFSASISATNTAGFLSATNLGGNDIMIGRLNAAGTAFDYLGFLGNTGADQGFAIKLDSSDNVYFVGQTTELGGTSDGFVGKILNEPSLAVAADSGNVVLSWPAFAPEFRLLTATNLPPTNGWVAVSNSPVVVSGRHTVTLPSTNDAAFFRLRKP